MLTSTEYSSHFSPVWLLVTPHCWKHEDIFSDRSITSQSFWVKRLLQTKGNSPEKGEEMSQHSQQLQEGHTSQAKGVLVGHQEYLLCFSCPNSNSIVVLNSPPPPKHLTWRLLSQPQLRSPFPWAGLLFALQKLHLILYNQLQVLPSQ